MIVPDSLKKFYGVPLSAVDDSKSSTAPIEFQDATSFSKQGLKQFYTATDTKEKSNVGHGTRDSLDIPTQQQPRP